MRIDIYNVLDQLITTVIDQSLTAGNHQDASQHTSGIYLYCMQAGDFTEPRKMLLVK